MPKINVIVVLGPTSSGKSDLAVKLAKKLKLETGLGSEIISADSRQIYKDMNLGTGKVEGVWKKINAEKLRSKASQSVRSKASDKEVFMYEGVPHYIIDFLEPTTHSSESEKYNVTNFRRDCLQAIDEISARGNVPILCGGTGFWISALIDNVEFPKVVPNAKLRKELDKKSAGELFELLQEKDPKRAGKIDSENKFRLIRALEICEKLGTVPEPKYNPPEHLNFLQIGLDYPVKKLGEKIKKRLASRWTDGMLEEVANLKNKYKMSWKEIEAFGLAYYWIPRYLQDKLETSQGDLITDEKEAKNELLERVYFAEKNYAKRQRTWFNRDKRIVWTTDFEEILRLSKEFLNL